MEPLTITMGLGFLVIRFHPFWWVSRSRYVPGIRLVKEYFPFASVTAVLIPEPWTRTKRMVQPARPGSPESLIPLRFASLNFMPLICPPCVIVLRVLVMVQILLVPAVSLIVPFELQSPLMTAV